MSTSEHIGVRLDVLAAIIDDLGGDPDMQWVVGEPVSDGLVLVAECDRVRIRPAPDVAQLSDDRERVLRAIDTAVAADSAWPPTPGPSGRTLARHTALCLGKGQLPLGTVHLLLRDLAGNDELTALLGAAPPEALSVCAEGGQLTLEAVLPQPPSEEDAASLERILRSTVAHDVD